MLLILSVFIIAAMLCFLVITAIKVWSYRRYPIHSRLELYPVPKEGGKRAEYGGSYFEEPEWWKKPRTLDGANEAKDIFLEMLFIRKLFRNHKSLWWASYVFHLGVYVMFAWTILLLLATIWPLVWLVSLAAVVGVAGFVLATIGALLLLARRVFDATLRSYTTPAEYFNIILILCVLVTGLISWIMMSPFVVASELLDFGSVNLGSVGFGGFSDLPLPPLVVIHIVLLGLMLVYIPASKMSHYVGKFFAFHKVLWDNDPNQQGNEVNLRLKRASSRTPKTTWSAPHVKPYVNSSDLAEK